MEYIVQSISEKHGLSFEIEWIQSFASCENEVEASGIVMDVVNNLGLSVIHPEQPFKWGEDFGLFSQKYKGCIFGLGAGLDRPALHNPDYDFPDELTSIGAEIFYQIILKITTAND